MQRRFKVVLDWNSNVGGYTVTVPALPGCITEGDTVDEALANVREAITGYLKVLERLGKTAPVSDLLPVERQELVINI
mgnify:CR=1 FL=1